MDVEASAWSSVVKRVEKLERQNRRLKQAGAVALILAAAVLLMGQASPTRTVEANEFVLKDSSGTVRGKFSMLIDEPQLMLYDANGGPQVWLSAGIVPSLYLSTSESIVSLSIAPDWTGLHMSAGLDIRSLPKSSQELRKQLEATTRASLLFGRDGTILELNDREGFKTIIGTTDLVAPRTGETHKTSAASVILFDKDKKVLWKAP